jgi:Transposase DNA-binding
MLAPWVIEEMETADLADKRLNKRLVQILSDFAGRPTCVEQRGQRPGLYCGCPYGAAGSDAGIVAPVSFLETVAS